MGSKTKSFSTGCALSAKARIVIQQQQQRHRPRSLARLLHNLDGRRRTRRGHILRIERPARLVSARQRDPHQRPDRDNLRRLRNRPIPNHPRYTRPSSYSVRRPRRAWAVRLMNLVAFSAKVPESVRTAGQLDGPIQSSLPISCFSCSSDDGNSEGDE